jgi:hypothetical protein
VPVLSGAIPVTEPDEKPKRRKKPSVSPTARSLAECRKRGWLAQGVEQTVPHTFIKRDLFGCIDLVALDGQPGLLGIQATGDHGGDVQRRVRKIVGECQAAALRWLAAGNRLEVWGWGLRGGEGERKRWTLRVVPVSSLMMVKLLDEEAGGGACRSG